MTKSMTPEDRYGKVRPIISTDFQDYKFVAVGEQLLYSKKWKTFPDFLMEYAKVKLGSDWGNAELAKPVNLRHPIIRWYTETREFQKKQHKDNDGIYKVQPSGPMFAFFSLAYDLYVLDHHSYLQGEILKRLKHTDQFQGARYELSAVSTFIRAGFEIAFEDEKDGTKKHPEFIATHKETKQKISVEAKTKAKSKNLNGACSIINNALKKENGHPFVIFLDLNMPQEQAEYEFGKPFPNKISGILDQVSPSEKGNDRFNMIVFTNQPHNLMSGDEPAPPSKVFCAISEKAEIPIDLDIMLALQIAASQTSIPNDFPKTS